MADSSFPCQKCGTLLPGEPSSGVCPACAVLSYYEDDLQGNVPAEFPDDLDIPGYTEIEPIAQGGMSRVFRARHIESDGIVALKVISRVYSENPEFEERFIQEGHTMAELDHPNIVTVHEVGRTDEDDLFFAMELIEGTTLREKISEEMGGPQILDITRQVCDALNYAHQLGVVHRDIKPGNILISEAGVVKVTDFGLAKIIGEQRDPELSSLTLTNVAMGTPDYMAPEQRIATNQVDHRADIYSVGVVLYEMLTGKLPIGAYKSPSQLNAKVYGEPVDRVVEKAMQSEPEDRYDDAGEIGTGLKRAIGALSKWRRRQFMALGGTGIIAGTGSAWFLNRGSPLPMARGKGTLVLIPLPSNTKDIRRDQFPRAPWDQELMMLKTFMESRLQKSLWFGGLDTDGNVFTWGQKENQAPSTGPVTSLQNAIDFELGHGQVFGISKERKLIFEEGSESAFESIRDTGTSQIMVVEDILYWIDVNGHLSVTNLTKNPQKTSIEAPSNSPDTKFVSMANTGRNKAFMTSAGGIFIARVSDGRSVIDLGTITPPPVHLSGGIGDGFFLIMADGTLRLITPEGIVPLPEPFEQITDAVHCISTNNRNRRFIFIQRKSGGWYAFRGKNDQPVYERLIDLEPGLKNVIDIAPGIGCLFALEKAK